MELNTRRYSKAIGGSLVIHGTLLFLSVWLGQAAPLAANPPAAIEIVPASVLQADMEMADEAPAPPEAQQTAQTPAQSAAYNEPRPQVLQGKPSETAMAIPAAYTTGTAAVATPVDSGSTAEKTSQPDVPKSTAAPIKPTTANVVSGASPRYPASARQSGWEGTVTVRVLVDVDGTAASVSVRDSSGRDVFDDAAVNAVKRWRFSPATQGGEPVASYHDVKVRFRLTDY